MPVPTTREMILSILGDTNDKAYPIYREGAAPDDSYTVASFFVDAENLEAEVFWSNPSAPSAPSTKYSLLQRLQ